ncbi:hypothetical protein Dpo_1c08730 [Desulfotignum phosphitoxidans DSM 13687]|uniref:Uncharacterized protein n=1 Tax=Desulfotignum phosphitoxidans DSM 13687 TaxID=1286635 RepID=S0G8B2_9BACT|nr:hypothetical protein Dpo_1c08730 [Desulfotignum phosphitoxidans DSM 13687]
MVSQANEKALSRLNRSAPRCIQISNAAKP